MDVALLVPMTAAVSIDFLEYAPINALTLVALA